MIICALSIGLLLGSPLALSKEAKTSENITVVSKKEKEIKDTLEALKTILKIKNNLEKTLKSLKAQVKSSASESEKKYLQEHIAVVDEKLITIEENFEELATNTDISLLKKNTEEKFNLETEIIALIKPTLEEMNHMTKNVRKKSELREQLAGYEEKQKHINEAITNIDKLLKNIKNNNALKKALKKTKDYWKQQKAFINSQQQSSSLQLKKLEESDISFTESTQTYFKQFFQQRGFYLFQAIMVITLILLLSQFSRYLLKKFVSGFSRHPRSFRMRLLDLWHRLTTLILVTLGPMIVFYLAEDWVLFSLSILLLIGIAWGLRTAIPQYWCQIQLFLNVGAVREGERIFLEGIPWRVGVINIYSILENPVADIKQRVPIKDLVNLKSRPVHRSEPWFPCTKGDWVILSDETRGKVIGISHELVKLVMRGGAHKTYLTTEFLALSPLNLAVDFRIKETIGISYTLQADSTTSILDTLKTYIEKRIKEEGYEDDLLNLRVEFEKANSSSLDIVIIADFKGHLGDIYNRIRRAIQRWCVDACTENQWEIPFTQITLHNTVETSEIKYVNEVE